MQYTKNQTYMLNKVNEIGLQIDIPDIENIIYILLTPYLDQLTALLKQSKPIEIDMIFMRYEGVMKIMRMIENDAKKMKIELGLK